MCTRPILTDGDVKKLARRRMSLSCHTKRTRPLTWLRAIIASALLLEWMNQLVDWRQMLPIRTCKIEFESSADEMMHAYYFCDGRISSLENDEKVYLKCSVIRCELTLGYRKVFIARGLLSPRIATNSWVEAAPARLARGVSIVSQSRRGACREPWKDLPRTLSYTDLGKTYTR